MQHGSKLLEGLIVMKQRPQIKSLLGGGEAVDREEDKDSVSLCNPNCPTTHSVNQAELKHREALSLPLPLECWIKGVPDHPLASGCFCRVILS